MSRREGETDGQKWELLCVQGRYMGKGMRSWGGPERGMAVERASLQTGGSPWENAGLSRM